MTLLSFVFALADSCRQGSSATGNDSVYAEMVEVNDSASKVPLHDDGEEIHEDESSHWIQDHLCKKKKNQK